MSGQANGTFIVTKKWGGRLGVADVFEGGTFRASELCVGVSSRQLGFSSGADIDGNAGGDTVNGRVDEVGGVVSEGMEPSSFGAGVWEGEIGGVGVDCEEHGRWADDATVVGEFGEVAEETFGGGHDGGSGSGLEGGKGGDDFKDGGVHGSGIVEGGANDLLQLGGFRRGSRGRQISGGKLRGSGAVDGGGIYGWGGGVLDAVGAVAFQHFGNVVGHGGGDGTGSAVVVDGEAEESGGDGVGFDVVLGGEGVDEAMVVGDVMVLNAVVVDDEGKVNGVKRVCE